ncbi:MAG TPA: phosphotransferase [Terriglobales bacterium]|nr:phosphotransferase [Terriglobales bacterium]
MAAMEHGGHETYRVIIFDRHGTRALLVPDHGRFALPFVQIERWQRVAENIAAALREDWGVDVICLFELEDVPCPIVETNRYCVSEFRDSFPGHKQPAQWSLLSDPSPHSFADFNDFEAIRRSIARCLAPANESSASPFARLGWFDDLRQWVSSTIEPLHLYLTDEFRQLNASASFSLIRFETDGPALWFKAVGEPNQREFSITCTLSQLFPEYLPRLLAVRPNCNGWLATEAPGQSLSETQEGEVWQSATRALADLQIQSIHSTREILSAGALDLSIATLSEAVQPFLKTMARLMAKQTRVPPPVLNWDELLNLGEDIQAALHRMKTLEVPEALGHLDLNPGNLVASPDRCVFLDWAEAYVGLPFMTFEYLREHLRRTIGKESSVEEKLANLYCQQWEQVLSPAVIREVFTLSPLLAVFGYAAGNDTWKKANRLEDPHTAGYFRSLTRRMHREANARVDRSFVCAGR